MSKMKHLLRKLHIGNNHNNHHHHNRRVSDNHTPAATTATTATATSSSSSVSSPPSAFDSSDPVVREPPTVTAENVNVNVNGECRNPPVNFNFFEEEFQVQLAMALSASDPETCKDEESNQIKAAKQMSLACSPDNERLTEFLSLKYWNYSVIQYDEKVVDGFYDAYAIASNSISQGEMPLLVDLQAISILDNAEYEVVLVNRSIDFQLRQLENEVYDISVECRVLEHGWLLTGLIQRIADLVVDRMGGPVGDAEDLMKRWRTRTNQLRGSLKNMVLPLGYLDVGLTRHRALLFKVLADRINLPCMLVKGSLYTGTDEGAVNLIKFDDGCEYIIDLMGAPGTLIPAEIPSALLPDTSSEARAFSDRTTAFNNLNLVFDKVVGLDATIPDIVEVAEVCGSDSKEVISESTQAKQENEVYIKSEFCLYDGSSNLVEQESLAQEKKVKDVSKYVISAAKDPEFAQKLHAVLLESGASPPADLFSGINPDILGENKLFGQVQPVRWEIMGTRTSYSLGGGYRSNHDMPLLCLSGVQPLNNCDDKSEHDVGNSTGQQLQLGNNEDVGLVTVVDCSNGMDGHDGQIFQDSSGMFMNQIEESEKSAVGVMETTQMGWLTSCSDQCSNTVSGNRVSPMLGEFAEWEIPWEDLQIGERIGIGSYGEVYRADWNGTEVAVKKFLVQDFTSDVLVQLKSEAEMLIRLRHPNVVLFMGAVTRPPNLSILTEFIPRGSLYRLLHRSGTQLDEKKRMKMAVDVARGMNYLHTSHPTVVHRDLKSPNLLVDKNWVVKVCDFGLSRLKHHTFLSSKSSAGTPEWMAPEVLRNEPSDEKCDVYSFGVILWELATLCIPWSGLNPMQVVGAVGFQNRHLEIPGEVDPMVAQIIRDCWEIDPRLRPSFSQLILRLKGLQRLVVQRD